MSPRARRRAAAATFWLLAAGFVAADQWRAAPRDRFAEPPPIALGSGVAAGGGHCSAAPAPR